MQQIINDDEKKFDAIETKAGTLSSAKCGFLIIISNAVCSMHAYISMCKLYIIIIRIMHMPNGSTTINVSITIIYFVCELQPV